MTLIPCPWPFSTISQIFSSLTTHCHHLRQPSQELDSISNSWIRNEPDRMLKKKKKEKQLLKETLDMFGGWRHAWEQPRAGKGSQNMGRKTQLQGWKKVPDRNKLKFEKLLRSKETSFSFLFGMRKAAGMVWTCRRGRWCHVMSWRGNKAGTSNGTTTFSWETSTEREWVWVKQISVVEKPWNR